VPEQYDPSKPNEYVESVKVSAPEEVPPPPLSPSDLPPTPTKSAEEKALSMMQKYGFRVGEGLGRNSQGMTTPLIAQKTSDTTGVIRASTIEMDVSSRVIVLMNMVTAVDDDLE
jgi:splicing factor 45